MTLESTLSEGVGSFSLLSYSIGIAGWGSLILVLLLSISLLSILKRRGRMKNAGILIYQHRQYELRQNSTQQWERGKRHIRQLLYEITEQEQILESQQSQPAEFSIPDMRLNNIINKRENAAADPAKSSAWPGQSRQSNTPLDIEELQAVAIMARRLSSRSRQHVSS